MADATTEFFDALAERGHEPLLEKTTGTVRFDLRDGKKTERWHVAVVKGDLAVSRQNLRADCVVSADKALFDGVASGKTNATAALLRGAMNVEGDVQLLEHRRPPFEQGAETLGGIAARRPGPSARRPRGSGWIGYCSASIGVIISRGTARRSGLSTPPV